VPGTTHIAGVVVGIIVITNLFPNPCEPFRSSFNEKQIITLSEKSKLEVIAPISWMTKRLFRKQGKLSEIKKCKKWKNIPVSYPSYYHVPGLFRGLNGLFMFLSIFRNFLKTDHKQCTVLFGTWLFPDGFSTVLLSKIFKKDVLLKVHGSDVELLAKNRLRRYFSVWAANNANAIIAVSDYLKMELVKYGVAENKIHTIYNGTDKDVFYVNSDKKHTDKNLVKKNIGVYVGNLKKEKGVFDFIKSVSPEFCVENNLEIRVIGDGQLRKQLEEYVNNEKLASYITFLGRMPQHDIADILRQASFLCLPSYHEGLPNVLVESISCGTPVIASNVGGIPEIINHENGVLVKPGQMAEISKAISTVVNKEWQREVVSKSINISTWTDNATEIHNLIERVACTRT
jgi:glycosyltransferase involved in cell wall biosynthesis